MSNNVIFPEPLKKGDLIAILSPAGPIDESKVLAAKEVLEKEGFRVTIMPHTPSTAGATMPAPTKTAWPTSRPHSPTPR